LAIAVALASHAALALEAAQERARSQRHQHGLEQLLHVTSQLPQTISTEAMLTSVCEAISDALEFDKVLIQLVEPGTGRLQPVAAAGLSDEEVEASGTLHLDRISRLFEPEFDIAGCYLVPRAGAAEGVGGRHAR